ncbi:MAG TPA: methyltransferase domain-containing protein [Saprospiraceae bacterium]|nr:methyltransferase domain-containing protein [Saprospiraceae bacterium]HPN72049.1 methyltransferase domain-containing protein [Saprospiraceae bacterium]
MANQNLDSTYWNSRYIEENTPWDIGYPSPALVSYLKSQVKPGCKILIPGAGKAYEATWLIETMDHFELTIVDLSIDLVDKLKVKFQNFANVEVICLDFFELEGKYDLILEQTFFCAIDPSLRNQYLAKMKSLLSPGGKLAGLLFNVEFEKAGPPFGGSSVEYVNAFNQYFSEYFIDYFPNSIPQRSGNEIFFEISLTEK